MSVVEMTPTITTSGSRKRKAEPLAECVPPVLASLAHNNTLNGNSNGYIAYHNGNGHHQHQPHSHYSALSTPPPAKQRFLLHSSASSSSSSLLDGLDDGSHGELSNGGHDSLSELGDSSFIGSSNGTNESSGRRKQRHETSLGQLTKKFVALLNQASDGEVNLNDASTLLKVQKRRIYDITNVLEGVGLLNKTFKNKIKWIGAQGQTAEQARLLAPGQGSKAGGLEQRRKQLEADLKQLDQSEKELERKLQLAMSSLTHLSEDEENRQFAYLTYHDIRSIDTLANQTVIAIKAPSETKLEVPDPREKLQMWLKSEKGEIEVYICPEDETDKQARDSTDAGRGESITSEMDTIIKNKAESKESKENFANSNQTSTSLKHAFISEDDDLGLIGGRNLQTQTDDQPNILGKITSGSLFTNSSNIPSTAQTAVHSSPGNMNDLLFMQLQPPLSEEDYNFALEDSEGIADLFGEMLPTYK